MAQVSERTPSGRDDRLAVRFYNIDVAADGKLAILALALLALGLLAGVGLLVVIGFATPTKADWNIIFIALGTLCLGFGGASALYQHLRSRENIELNAQYESLRQRSRALIDDFRAYEKAQSR